MIFPTSFAQQRLLLVEQLMPGTPAFHIPTALRLRGPLRRDALLRAVDEVVARHESLHTVFLTVDGEAVQLIDPDLRVPVDERDLRGQPAAMSADELLEVLVAESERPFALDQRALRVTLFQLAEDDAVLALTLHHTIADLWSCAVFFRELAHFYGGGGELPPLDVQYVDYAIWQREQLTEEAEAGLLAFWREALDGAPRRLEVPGDRPRPAEPGLRGGSEPVGMPAAVARGARAVARELGATPFMVLLAGWDAVLARWTGQSDLVVSTSVATRTGQVEDLIGCFINVLLIRASVAGDPDFAELVDRVRRATLDAVDHQDLPFDRLVRHLAPESRGGHQPMTQVMVNLQNAPMADLLLPGLEVDAIVVPRRAAQLDLTLDLWTSGDTFDGVIEYSSDVFASGTVRALWAQYVTLLGAAVEAPRTPLSRLPLQGEEAGGARISPPAALPAAEPVPVRVAARAVADPDGVALTGPDGTVSWAELIARVRAVDLPAVGPVPVPAAPLLDSVVGQLAALAAGRTYLAVEPTHPAALTADLAAAPVPGVPAVLVGRGDGTVVALPPAAIDAAVNALTGDDGIRAGDRLLAMPSWAGERAPYAALSALAAGATLVVPAVVPADAGVTVWLSTASELSGMLDGANLARLRLVVLYGERPAPELVERLAAAAPGARLRHVAGPLEAAVGIALVADGATGTYRPVAGLAAVVLDGTGRVAAPAQPGELYLWGPAVALASPRLVPHPLAGAKGVPAGSVAVRSGLTARYAPGGGIEVGAPTGRHVLSDGYDIDLDVVSAALAKSPAVREAVVLAEGGRLVAWHAGGVEAELVTYLAAGLPAPAVPTCYVAVDRLPTDRDGGVDTDALPRRPKGAAAAAGRVAPRTPLETVVADVWGSVLGTPGIGANDDFLDLGGHSIAAMQVAALLVDTLGVEVSVRTIFTGPTVAGLAELLRELGRACGVDVDAAAGDALAVGEMADDELRRLLDAGGPVRPVE